MRNTLVTDTSVLYAALDRDEQDHESCAALLVSGPVVTVPAPVLGEVDWLGRRRRKPNAGESLLAGVLDTSTLVVDLDHEDWRRVRDLLTRYADLPLNLVDAAVVAIAERLEQDTIATLDRRHFSVIRPLHVPAFTLLP